MNMADAHVLYGGSPSASPGLSQRKAAASPRGQNEEEQRPHGVTSFLSLPFENLWQTIVQIEPREQAADLHPCCVEVFPFSWEKAAQAFPFSDTVTLCIPTRRCQQTENPTGQKCLLTHASPIPAIPHGNPFYTGVAEKREV